MKHWRILGAALLGITLVGAVSLVIAKGPSKVPVSLAASSSGDWWQPGQLTSWAYAIGEEPVAVPTNLGNVQAYDIDYDGGESQTEAQVAATVAAIHATGAHAICYMETGSWENYRPDASEYPTSILGDTMPGYSAEKFVNINNLNSPAGPTGLTLHQILDNRIDQCKAEGFDAVETDLDDTYSNNDGTTGFTITMADELAFNNTIAGDIHAAGMAWFFKNGIEGDSFITGTMAEPNLPDGTVDEECNYYADCSALEPFVTAGKPILNVEYTDDTPNPTEATLCTAALAFPMATIMTDVNLDGHLSYGCWQYGDPGTSGTNPPTTTVPPTTVPPTTVPPTTVPPTTVPPTTVPPTTAPPITAPPTTVPPITAPPTTAPPITVPVWHGPDRHHHAPFGGPFCGAGANGACTP